MAVRSLPVYHYRLYITQEDMTTGIVLIRISRKEMVVWFINPSPPAPLPEREERHGTLQQLSSLPILTLALWETVARSAG